MSKAKQKQQEEEEAGEERAGPMDITGLEQSGISAGKKTLCVVKFKIVIGDVKKLQAAGM